MGEIRKHGAGRRSVNELCARRITKSRNKTNWTVILLGHELHERLRRGIGLVPEHCRDHQLSLIRPLLYAARRAGSAPALYSSFCNLYRSFRSTLLERATSATSGAAAAAAATLFALVAAAAA